MKYVEEYRDPAAAEALVKKIAQVTGDGAWCFMEVCGTHTMAIYRYGVKSLMPEGIRLISGPGCPVCVSPVGYLDKALASFIIRISLSINCRALSKSPVRSLVRSEAGGYLVL